MAARPDVVPVPWPIRLLRWALAGTMLLYGVIKLGIGGSQFVYDWHEVTFRRDDPNAFTMVWYFFGYSRVYGTFIALCEIVPALLLLWRRTATLGAAGVFAVMANVTVMDWCFGLPLPATLFATALCSGALGLLWFDRRKLAAAFC